MKKYCLGFVFTPDLEKVLLMHRLRPEWQAGKINGLGGKFEENEDGLNAMVREIREECGLESKKEDWSPVGILEGETWIMDVFGYIFSGDIVEIKSLEDQQVEWFEVHNLPMNVISNLQWLIPLTIDKMKNDE